MNVRLTPNLRDGTWISLTGFAEADLYPCPQREDLPAGRLDIPSTSSALASAMMQNVRRLRSLGARHILLINLPPLDRSPKYSLPHEAGIRSHELIGQSVRVFNTRLEELVRAYRLELELEKDNDEDETNVFLFDLWSYWNLVLDYPEVFGMTDCSRYKVLVNGDDVNLGRLGFW
jgi:phospholipase/lecithinase/hemolysin